MPVRIQRKRTKGWRMPPNSRYCGRPGIYGNPFVINLPFQTAEQAVQRYDNWLRGVAEEGRIPYARERRDKILRLLPKLADYDYLSDWCALDEPCHVDVIITLLDELTGEYSDARQH